MLLMLEKGIAERIWHSLHRYTKAYDKKKESLYLQYWDVNNFYGWAMSQKLPVSNFE